jgi:hypothetical protein
MWHEDYEKGVGGTQRKAANYQWPVFVVLALMVLVALYVTRDPTPKISLPQVSHHESEIAK